ncbi:MAG: hypothetical protein ACTSRG_22550 [Candidatus Helarchaeota archaeon]
MIQAKMAFLNGSESRKEGAGDVSMPKVYEVNGIEYPYISAQCWRRWWRLNFEKELNMFLKKYKIEQQLQNYDFLRASDDLFGYFTNLPKKVDLSRINKLNISQIRSSPIQISQLHPVQNSDKKADETFLNKDNAFIHLLNDTPLPYSSRFYNADLQSILAIDLNRISRYKNFNDRQELFTEIIKKYMKHNLILKISDDYYEIKDASDIRWNRVAYVLQSLLTISGGAKLAQYGVDITPKILLLAGQNASNPILSMIFEIDRGMFHINYDLLLQRVKTFRHIFTTSIYLGVRKGYVNNINEISNLKQEFYDETRIKLIITTPMNVIERIREAAS